MSKTTPANREDRCGTTALDSNTPRRRERTRRREPQPDVDASEQRCKIEKPCQKDSSALSMKRDPSYRPGQWHRQRGMIRPGRPERQQVPLQRAHAKTTRRNKSLKWSQEPKSTCQVERGGRSNNKASRHRQKTCHPHKGRKNLTGPKSKETPR